MPLGSNFNVWNTCLRILRLRGYAIEVEGELDADGCWPCDALWIAKKNQFCFMGDNPIELLGLVGVYDHVQPDHDDDYWWRVDGEDIRREVMRKTFPDLPSITVQGKDARNRSLKAEAELTAEGMQKVDAAWNRLIENKDDGVQFTFCYQLFETAYFNNQLFLPLCEDMDFVLEEDLVPKQNYEVLIWIISSIFKCVFSHFDEKDLYKITNFDSEVSGNWNAEYLERLRDLLEKIFNVVIDGHKKAI